MPADDRWNWERCQEQIASLRGRLGFPDIGRIKFLDLCLDLRSGDLTSEPSGTPVTGLRAVVFCILDTYSRANGSPEAFRLVPFRELPGGPAYDTAFRSRVIHPLATQYAYNAEVFSHAVMRLGGLPVAYADHAWKVYALPRVPIYILIWDGSEEFPPSSALFFDASISAYLETEAAAMLGDLVLQRILGQDVE